MDCIRTFPSLSQTLTCHPVLARPVKLDNPSYLLVRTVSRKTKWKVNNFLDDRLYLIEEIAGTAPGIFINCTM